MLVYWLIFAAFAVGAVSVASRISRLGLMPVSGQAAEFVARRSIAFSAAGLALMLLIGLRYEVGGDWSNYFDIFRRKINRRF